MAGADPDARPWPALYALCLGFFMILVDLTIVTVATPTIIDKLDASVNDVVWVTSAYMLAYAVPVLITGRLGDRYGSKRLYLAGLTVFTLASLWCGLTATIGMLILARVVQGLGASMMTPQTMAIITRIFPAAERGKAMAVWGATAGIAMVVGPVLGGVLTDGLGWEWIFFVNVPVGIAGVRDGLAPGAEPADQRAPLRLAGRGAVRRRPVPARVRRPGGPPEALGRLDHRDDRRRRGRCSALFVLWQARNKQEPLVPLSLFRDRNFSVSNVAITVMGFVAASMGFPLMLWAQAVRGFSPLQSALLFLPMAAMSIVLAQPVGNLTDRVHPRIVVGTGFALSCVGMVLLTTQFKVDSPIWLICVFQVILGCGNAFIWAPTAATANRNLPLQLAGAGAGVYNATRQVGSVMGAAAIAVMMDSRIAHYLPGAAAHGDAGAGHITNPAGRRPVLQGDAAGLPAPHGRLRARPARRPRLRAPPARGLPGRPAPDTWGWGCGWAGAGVAACGSAL